MKILRTATILATLLLCSCIGAPQQRFFDSGVIDGDAVWSGEVRISGLVRVTKEASLKILPGTRIVFERIDLDHDGIGDSELLIEGGLIARGTAEEPILFTSAAAEPQRADWKYIALDFAREAVVEHVISEYAYSGIQAHFCKARITDSIFRHNVDGVRFSTVNLELAGNLIHDNVHGLRYEERRSEARIHHNEIRDNHIGIFAVTRCEDRAIIENNNITGSLRYQVKLGFEQQGDLTFPRNWWGTTDIPTIEANFFDKAFDPQIGRVSAPEPLSAPVKIEGWKGESTPGPKT